LRGSRAISAGAAARVALWNSCCAPAHRKRLTSGNAFNPVGSTRRMLLQT
jgi:hypothetical protein